MADKTKTSGLWSKCEYWLVSIPGEPNRHEAFMDFKKSISEKKYVTFEKVKIPSFKLCTFNRMMELLDHLKKIDYDGKRILDRMKENVDSYFQGEEFFFSASAELNYFQPGNYIKDFVWNKSRYPYWYTVSDIVEKLSEEIKSLDTYLNEKIVEYTNAVTVLDNITKKGPKSVNLANLLENSTGYIIETRTMETVLIEVPEILSPIWETTYEHIHSEIIPRSSVKLGGTPEMSVYTLALSRRIVDQLAAYLHEYSKLELKIFNFSELAGEIAKLASIRKDKSLSYKSMIMFILLNFKHAFITWIHIKHIMVYIDSIIRFGLPFRFQAILIQPKNNRRREIMNKIKTHYAHLDFNVIPKKEESAYTDYEPIVFTSMKFSYISPQTPKVKIKL